MAQTPSTMLPLGTKLPAFRLPDAAGKTVSSEDLQSSPVLLVAFICNHCPFVKHIREQFADLARSYQRRGVAVVAVNSNDAEKYPDDNPQAMAEIARQFGFTFPYLYDATQEVAKKFQAACTPDLFVFDRDRELAYRGQFDDSRPGNDKPVTGKDLRQALDALLEGKPVTQDQTPSIGCNIKWKAGGEPEYAAQPAAAKS
jgi:peroxiredoxin